MFVNMGKTAEAHAAPCARLLPTMLLACFIVAGVGGNIEDLIYKSVDVTAYCIRLMNNTDQTGCQSELNGNIGVVHYIETSDDLDWLIEEGPHSPYIPVLTSDTFNNETVGKLIDSNKISGVIVINNNSTDAPQDGFSPDNRCPNENFGLYVHGSKYDHCSSVEWNPLGNGLSYMDLPFPVFVVSEAADHDFLLGDCYEKFNKPVNDSAPDYPLCAVQMSMFMFGAVDTPTCMRRSLLNNNIKNPGYCDPLGDNNVHMTLQPYQTETTVPDKSLIIASAKLDSRSFFHGLDGGADSDGTGFIALLAAAQCLMAITDTSPFLYNIMFTFFQGETFDYIGSSRMVYDITHSEFSVGESLLNIDSVKYMLELEQVGLLDEGSLWVHTDPQAGESQAADIAVLVEVLNSSCESVNVSLQQPESGSPLPPASVQSFKDATSNLLEIPSLVLTDHHTHFTNKYYNSRFDLSEEIEAGDTGTVTYNTSVDTKQAKHLTRVATAVARALYTLATNGSTVNTTMIEADINTVGHMLYCFLHNSSCPLFEGILDSNNAAKLDGGPVSRYVTVSSVPNWVTILTHRLLVYFTDNCTESTDNKCVNDAQPGYTAVYMQGIEDVNGTRTGLCCESTAAFSLAESPVFTTNDWTSSHYSTWTESRWKTAASMRSFLISSDLLQTVNLAVGVIILLLSHLLIYFITIKSDVLFTSETVAL